MKSIPKFSFPGARVLTVVLIVFVAGQTRANAQTAIDYFLVLGAGMLSPWVTEYTVGNNEQDGKILVISTYPYESVTPTTSTPRLSGSLAMQQ